jgi:hypothetical protein
LALAVPRFAVSAGTTGLRCERRVDLLYPTRCLLLQPAYKDAPTACQDGSIEPRLCSNVLPRRLENASRRTSHHGKVQVLNADNVEAPRQIGRGLLDPVLAAISLPGLQPGDRYLYSAPPRRTESSTGEPSLKPVQPFPFMRGQAGHGKQLSGGQGGGYSNTPINSHHRTRSRRLHWFWYNGEGDVPASSGITGDTVGLHALFNYTRPTKPDPAHLGHPQLTNLAGQPPDPLGFHANDSETLVSPCLPPARLPIRTLEESTYSLREVPQRLLLHLYAPGTQPAKLSSGNGQLPALGREAGGVPSAGLPPRMLLYCKIPYVPRMRTMTRKQLLLSGRGLEPVATHVSKLSSTTDNLRGASALPLGRWPGIVARIR